MNDQIRQRQIAVMQRLLELCPDMRLGQTVAVVALLARPDDDDPVYHMEDEEFLAAAEEYLRNVEAFQQRQPTDQSLLQTAP